MLPEIIENAVVWLSIRYKSEGRSWLEKASAVSLARWGGLKHAPTML